MSREQPWIGVVSEDGRRIYFDLDRDFRAALKDMAGTEVEIVLRPRRRPITPEARGYWWAEIVRAYAEQVGEPSHLVAHFQLLHLLDWIPGQPTPSTSNAESDSAEMSDRIERACALLAGLGVVVQAPEPDPVKRFERKARAA